MIDMTFRHDSLPDETAYSGRFRVGSSGEIIRRDPALDTPEVARHAMHRLRAIARAAAHPDIDVPPRVTGQVHQSEARPTRTVEYIVTRNAELRDHGLQAALVVPVTSSSTDDPMDEDDDDDNPGIYDDDEAKMDYTVSDDEAAAAHQNCEAQRVCSGSISAAASAYNAGR